MKDLSKTWVLTGKLFEYSDRKNNRKKTLDLAEKKSWTQRFWKQQINISPANSTNMDLVNCKN